MIDGFGLNKSTIITVFLCMLIDLLDFVSDALEKGGQSTGAFAGLIAWLGDSADVFIVIFSLILLRIRSAPQLVMLSALVDPAYDEAWFPSCTITYLLSGIFGIESLTDKIPKIRR